MMVFYRFYTIVMSHKQLCQLLTVIIQLREPILAHSAADV